MEQNKLENQIKEKLNSREIQPSSQAWDRLDAMLSVSEEKKTKRSFGWLYIAASILVFVALGLFFFNPKSTGINPQNTVVETKVKKDSVKKEENKFNTPINQTEKNQAVVSTETENPKSQNTNNHQGVSIKNNQSNTNNQKQSANNPLINREKGIEYQNSSDVALKDLPKIETRKEIIVNSPKTNGANALTDEQLLASLDNSAKKSENKQPGLKVDAKSLLSQVDGELEMTFREKVINKVAKNYKGIKVALANRNNE